MSIKSMFSIMKSNGYLIPKIDTYLLQIEDDEDRGHDYISPSGIHTCPRAQMYRILGERREQNISPRLRRIFDVGHHVHAMIQGYLTREGVLLIDEAPVYSDRLKVTGHADGILRLENKGLGVLEIKTINSDGFKKLIDAKDEHKLQANLYVLCLEEIRKICRAPKNKLLYVKARNAFLSTYEKFMQTFVTDGSKYTKEEKITKKVEIMKSVMDLLRTCETPIDTIKFLYFNKDTQDLKEYEVRGDVKNMEVLEEACTTLVGLRERKELPPRPTEAVGKSCSLCRNCAYSTTCFTKGGKGATAEKPKTKPKKLLKRKKGR